MEKREINNETMLMAAIFGPWPPESNERYYDEINGVSLHDALIDAVSSVFGKYNGDHLRHSKRGPPRITFILNSPPSFSS